MMSTIEGSSADTAQAQAVAPAAPAPGRPALPPRVQLMGMAIDPLTEPQAIQAIIASLAAGVGGWVITPNLDQLRQFHEMPELRAFYNQADLILPDGMPLIWASRMQKTPLPARVPGSGLIYSLSAAAAANGRSIYLLGGNPGTAERAGQELSRLYSGLRVAGSYCPPYGFEKQPEEMQRIRESLIQSNADIVYVGLGFPKQERLIASIKDCLPRAWFLGIGISFSFVCGEVKRAPRWMQQTGLEWVHRMAQEPGRLFRRYVVHDIPFAARLFWNAAFRHA